MMIDYSPLFELLEERGMKLSHFRGENFNSKTQRRLSNNESVNLRTIEFLCLKLNVPIEKVVRISPDEVEK